MDDLIKATAIALPHLHDLLIQPLLAEHGPDSLDARVDILSKPYVWQEAKKAAPAFHIHFYPARPLNPMPAPSATPSMPPPNGDRTTQGTTAERALQSATLEEPCASTDPEGDGSEESPLDIEHTPLTALVAAHCMHPQAITTRESLNKKSHLFTAQWTRPWCSLFKTSCQQCRNFWTRAAIPEGNQGEAMKIIQTRELRVIKFTPNNTTFTLTPITEQPAPDVIYIRAPNIFDSKPHIDLVRINIATTLQITRTSLRIEHYDYRPIAYRPQDERVEGWSDNMVSQALDQNGDRYDDEDNNGEEDWAANSYELTGLEDGNEGDIDSDGSGESDTTFSPRLHHQTTRPPLAGLQTDTDARTAAWLAQVNAAFD